MFPIGQFLVCVTIVTFLIVTNVTKMSSPAIFTPRTTTLLLWIYNGYVRNKTESYHYYGDEVEKKWPKPLLERKNRQSEKDWVVCKAVAL